MEEKKVIKKTLTGTVMSEKMNKSIAVKVSTRRLHPLYKKYILRSKKYLVHDESNSAKTGDTVRIRECRPLSKRKCWRLFDILERAK